MSAENLTVVVTGPTGDIGRSTIRAIESSHEVGRVIGMARRPFEPADLGWTRATYRQGDVLDRDSADRLVEGADVVVHLAFIIFGGHEETRRINLEGSRNVFEAAVAANAKRLVYTSSVAAYGFHADNPQPLTEEVEPRGTASFYYSAQKAELEGLLREVVAGSDTDAYLFRPCIVAGPDATTLVTEMVRSTSAGGVLRPVQRLLEAAPLIGPVLPDPGLPLQLVHHEDVAQAVRAAVLGRGSPGVYNLAAEDTLTTRDLARELGWLSPPLPRRAVSAVAGMASRLPLLPARMGWVNALRVPMVMDCTKARRELDWQPQHSARETLGETVRAAREAGVL